MDTTVLQIKEIVHGQMMQIHDSLVKSELEKLMIEPNLHLRKWDYGSNGEVFNCWTIAVDESTDTSIIYCEYGFGPQCPWGLVSSSELYFGMDSGWFTSLVDCFLDSWAASELPIWFVERRLPSAKIEIVAQNLTSDEALLIINNEFKRDKKYHINARR